MTKANMINISTKQIYRNSSNHAPNWVGMVSLRPHWRAPILRLSAAPSREHSAGQDENTVNFGFNCPRLDLITTQQIHFEELRGMRGVAKSRMGNRITCSHVEAKLYPLDTAPDLGTGLAAAVAMSEQEIQWAVQRHDDGQPSPARDGNSTDFDFGSYEKEHLRPTH